MFLADSLPTWLENGVTNVDWWDIHNSPVCGTNDSSSLYGSTDYGEYGFLSVSYAGNCSTNPEPAADTPLPAYYGFKMTSHFVEPESTLLSATSSASLVSAHAAQRGDGNINVMLVNKDPATSYTATVSIDGRPWFGFADVFTYGMNSTSISWGFTLVSRSSFTVAVAPYSLTTVHLH